MNIEKKVDKTQLWIGISGRLDTMTAPMLEKTLKIEIDGKEILIIDFADVEYISSAGLRVLLSAQKIMKKQGEMVIKNVNSTIMEIFDVTGFSEILTIQ